MVYLPSGKPYLADGSAHISISHTNGYVAVALHPTEEVGIDIERYGVRVCRVVSRFVRPDEEKTMNQGDEVYVLLLHWSAKETLFKVMGVEGVDFIRHLHIFPFVMEEEGVFGSAGISDRGTVALSGALSDSSRFRAYLDYKKKCQRDSHQAGTQINLAEFILIKNLFYLIISFGIAKRRR